MHMKAILMFTGIFFTEPIALAHSRALVIVPVADLVGAPILSFNLAPTIKESYKKLALCGGKNDASQGCPRIHQALFNDIVEIVSLTPGKNGDEGEACIRYENAFFITHACHQPQTLYWTNVKNLFVLDEEASPKNITDFLPDYRSYKTPHKKPVNPTITLKKPFYASPPVKKLFSVGTRFVINSSLTTEKNVSAFIFDSKKQTINSLLIPKDYIQKTLSDTPQSRIHAFVALLREWTRSETQRIPYVWGGCSVTRFCPDHTFCEVPRKTKQSSVMVYSCKNCSSISHTGLDCAGLVFRAAQLCDIPYFFKNTHTLAHYLEPITRHGQLHEGDLIWFPGHVMVVSNKATNLTIEARGYSNGFGIVHEIPLSRIFQGIETYAQLEHAFFNQSPLIRLNREGKVVEKIKHFKLLRIASAWKYEGQVT